MAKWPNNFISGKQFQKRPNLAYLAFLKAKWQPCLGTFQIIRDTLGVARTWLNLIKPLGAYLGAITPLY